MKSTTTIQTIAFTSENLNSVIKAVELKELAKTVVGLGWSVITKDGKKVTRNKAELYELLVQHKVEAFDIDLITKEIVKIHFAQKGSKLHAAARMVAYEFMNGGDNTVDIKNKKKVLLSTHGEAVHALTAVNKELSTSVFDLMADGMDMRQALETIKTVDSKLASAVHAFMKFFFIPKKFLIPTRPQYVVLRADIDSMEEIDGKLFSTLKYDLEDYRNIGGGFLPQSAKDSIEQLGFTTVYVKKRVTTTVNNRKVSHYIKTPVRLVNRMAIVNIGAYIEDDEAAESTSEMIDRLFAEGFYIEGKQLKSKEDLHFLPIKRSTSEARQLRHKFLLNDVVGAVADVLMDNGTDPIMYTKDADKNNPDLRKLKVTDPDKRKALDGSDTIESTALRFGHKTLRVKPGTSIPAEHGERYEIILTGGAVSARFVDNPVALVSKGKFDILAKDNNDSSKTKRITLDASEYVQELMMLDGACAYNDYAGSLLDFEFGTNVHAFQFRAARTIIKGMNFRMPELHNYYEEDFIFFGGSVKGNIEEYIAAGHDINLRIARINPPSFKNKEYTILPYQGVHSTRLSTADLRTILQKHLDKIVDMVKNPELLKAYLGSDNLDEITEGMDASELESILDQKLTTTLSKALYHSKNKAFADTYLKQKAFQVIEVMLRKWFTGQVPVLGSYKYLIQDPKAVFDALKRSYELGDNVTADGDVFVPADMGLRPDTVVVTIWDDEGKCEIIYDGNVVLHRNPNLKIGQLSPVTSVNDEWYEKQVALGYFGNLIIVSCHDFALVRQGGADVDGDTSLVIFENTVVDHVFKYGLKDNAVLDRFVELDENGDIDPNTFDDGTPYKTPKEVDDNYYRLTEGSEPGQVLKQKAFEVEFHRNQYNKDLVLELMKLELDWVKRTLKKNFIGEMTNFATLLADAIRRLSNAITANKNIYGATLYANEEEAIAKKVNPVFVVHNLVQYRTWIAEFTEMIDTMYRGQSWEIDRPKHGGAYEEYMFEQFAFFLDSTKYPEMISRPTNRYKDGEVVRALVKPIWLEAFKKCQTLEEMFALYNNKYDEKKEKHIHSTLTQHFIDMMAWYKEFRTDFWKENGSMFDNNIMPLINKVAPEAAEYKAIATELEPIQSVFNSGNADISLAGNAFKSELKTKLESKELTFDKYVTILRQYDEDVKEQRKQLIMDCVDMLNASDVIENADPVHVGAVSYMMTYDMKKKGSIKFSTIMERMLQGVTGDKVKKRSLAFCWVITEAQLMKTLEAAVSDKEHVVSDVKEVLVESNTYMSFHVPAANFNINEVAAMISADYSRPLVVMLKTNTDGVPKYYAHAYNSLTERYEAIGVIYNSYADSFRGAYFDVYINPTLELRGNNINFFPTRILKRY